LLAGTLGVVLPVGTAGGGFWYLWPPDETASMEMDEAGSETFF
jgi:hypothetical protein